MKLDHVAEKLSGIGLSVFHFYLSKASELTLTHYSSTPTASSFDPQIVKPPLIVDTNCSSPTKQDPRTGSKSPSPPPHQTSKPTTPTPQHTHKPPSHIPPPAP